MADEFKLQQDASRATRAKTLLENELAIESWDYIEKTMMDAWIAASPRDVEGREATWRMIHANRKHREFFIKVMADGKLAAAELKELADNVERKKRFGII